MTQQAPEKIWVDDKLRYFNRPVAGWPFRAYLRAKGIPDSEDYFIYDDTSLQRGHVGTWELSNGRLYLIEIQGCHAVEDKPFLRGDEVTIRGIFHKDRVFFYWYTGDIIYEELGDLRELYFFRGRHAKSAAGRLLVKFFIFIERLRYYYGPIPD